MVSERRRVGVVELPKTSTYTALLLLRLLLSRRVALFVVQVFIFVDAQSFLDVVAQDVLVLHLLHLVGLLRPFLAGHFGCGSGSSSGCFCL